MKDETHVQDHNEVLDEHHHIQDPIHHEISKNKKNIKIIASLAVVAILGGGVFIARDTDFIKAINPFDYNFPEQLPVSLQERTHAAVAKVNGEKLDRDTYNNMLTAVAQNFITSGFDIEGNADAQLLVKETALQSLIDNTLLRQASEAVDIDITDEMVDARIFTVQMQLGGEEAYKKALANIDVKEKKYRTLVGEQLLLDEYVRTTLHTDEIVVTDDEIADFYTERIKTAPEGTDVPTLEDATEQIRAYLVEQKKSSLIEAHIAELRAQATIVRLAEFAQKEVEESDTSMADEDSMISTTTDTIVE